MNCQPTLVPSRFGLCDPPPHGQKLAQIFVNLLVNAAHAMPGMKLHAEIARRRPELIPKLWFITGGPSSAEAKCFVETHDARVLEKPITRASLAPVLAAAAQQLQISVAS